MSDRSWYPMTTITPPRGQSRRRDSRTPSTETIHDKALRLIEADAVTIRFQGDHLVDADVQGDHGKYPVVVYVGDEIMCWCPAHRKYGFTGDCAYQLAVVAVALQRNTGLPPAVTLGKVSV